MIKTVKKSENGIKVGNCYCKIVDGIYSLMEVKSMREDGYVVDYLLASDVMAMKFPYVEEGIVDGYIEINRPLFSYINDLFDSFFTEIEDVYHEKDIYAYTIQGNDTDGTTRQGNDEKLDDLRFTISWLLA